MRIAAFPRQLLAAAESGPTHARRRQCLQPAPGAFDLANWRALFRIRSNRAGSEGLPRPAPARRGMGMAEWAENLGSHEKDLR